MYLKKPKQPACDPRLFKINAHTSVPMVNTHNSWSFLHPMLKVQEMLDLQPVTGISATKADVVETAPEFLQP